MYDSTGSFTNYDFDQPNHPDFNAPEPLVTDEVTPKAYHVTDAVTDETMVLSDMNLRLERIENTVNALRDGVNTIGEMMNQVASAFDQVMQTVNQGGLGALLGGLMGGKKNG